METDPGSAGVADYPSLRQRSGSDQVFRQLLEGAPDAVVIVDSDGGIVLVNYQAEQLFQYDRAVLLGQPVEILVPERLRASHVRRRDTS